MLCVTERDVNICNVCMLLVLMLAMPRAMYDSSNDQPVCSVTTAAVLMMRLCYCGCIIAVIDASWLLRGGLRLTSLFLRFAGW